MLSYACGTLADHWPTPVGWTGSCPEVYYNFESLTPGSLTISLPNGGTHSTAVGYVRYLFSLQPFISLPHDPVESYQLAIQIRYGCFSVFILKLHLILNVEVFL